MNSGLAGRSEVAVTECLSESVIKAHAPRIKTRRAVAQPWRAHEDFATGPEHVSHTRGGGGVALSAATAPTPFSTQVTGMLTELSLE